MHVLALLSRKELLLPEDASDELDITGIVQAGGDAGSDADGAFYVADANNGTLKLVHPPSKSVRALWKTKCPYTKLVALCLLPAQGAHKEGGRRGEEHLMMAEAAQETPASPLWKYNLLLVGGSATQASRWHLIQRASLEETTSGPQARADLLAMATTGRRVLFAASRMAHLHEYLVEVVDSNGWRLVKGRTFELPAPFYSMASISRGDPIQEQIAPPGTNPNSPTDGPGNPVAGMDTSPVSGMDTSPVAGIDTSPVAGMDTSQVAGMDTSPVAQGDRNREYLALRLQGDPYDQAVCIVRLSGARCSLEFLHRVLFTGRPVQCLWDQTQAALLVHLWTRMKLEAEYALELLSLVEEGAMGMEGEEEVGTEGATKVPSGEIRFERTASCPLPSKHFISSWTLMRDTHASDAHTRLACFNLTRKELSILKIDLQA